VSRSRAHRRAPLGRVTAQGAARAARGSSAARLLVAALEIEIVAVAEHDATKAVPLRLVRQTGRAGISRVSSPTSARTWLHGKGHAVEATGRSPAPNTGADPRAHADVAVMPHFHAWRRNHLIIAAIHRSLTDCADILGRGGNMLRTLARRTPLIVAAITIAGFVGINGSPSGATGTWCRVCEGRSGSVRSGVDGLLSTTTATPRPPRPPQTAPTRSKSPPAPTKRPFDGIWFRPTRPRPRRRELGPRAHRDQRPNQTSHFPRPPRSTSTSSTAPTPYRQRRHIRRSRHRSAPLSAALHAIRTEHLRWSNHRRQRNVTLPALLGDPALPITVEPPAGLSFTTNVNVSTDPPRPPFSPHPTDGCRVW